MKIPMIVRVLILAASVWMFVRLTAGPLFEQSQLDAEDHDGD